MGKRDSLESFITISSSYQIFSRLLLSRLHILKMKARVSWLRRLSRDWQLLLSGPLIPIFLPQHDSTLAPFVHGDNLDLDAPRRLLQPSPHLPQYVQLVKGQLPLKYGRAAFARHESAFEALDKRHGFLHFGLGDLRAKFLFINSEGQAVEASAHHVNVLVLPGGVGGRDENGKPFREFGVEGDGFAFFFLLKLGRFGRRDAGRCGAHIVAGGG